LIYKRNKIYHYKFMHDGELIRKTTRQGSHKKAREMETAERNRLATEGDERIAAKGRLNCTDVFRCQECGQWFDAAITITVNVTERFCSNHCRDTWVKKHRVTPTLHAFCDSRIKPYTKATYERSSPKTYRWYLFGIAVLTTTAVGKLRLDEIGAEQIASLMSELQERKKTAKGKGGKLQLSTINSCLRAMRRVLHLAVEWGVIDAAPKVRMLSGERRRERVITPDEEAKYLAAGSELLHDVSLLLFDTGMRPEECHRMRWEFVNWNGGRYGVVLIPDGKTDAARRLLPLSVRVRLSLEKRWKDAGEPMEGWVWPADNKDEHINHDSLKSQHKKSIRLAKIRSFDVYSIRHTFLTRLGESGCDAWTLARIAGHSNIKMSHRYVHPSADAVLNAVSRVGGHKNGHSGEMSLGSGEAPTHETDSDC